MEGGRESFVLEFFFLVFLDLLVSFLFFLELDWEGSLRLEDELEER